ncbi:MAG: PTS transporter subunit EIIC [Lachnospiraceae bacterium]|nr:PTS transporter subunit EIIC [Lachnospiraceae bacterium]
MEPQTKKNILTILIDHISSCMAPIIPIVIAGGLVKLLVVIFTMTGILLEGSSTEAVLSFIGDAPLYFLPFFLAYTASVHFHVNTILAIGAVGALMSPSFVELANSPQALSFLGIPLIKATYAYSTIPVILLIAAMVWIEKLVHRWMPKVVDDVLSPLVILLLSSLVGLLAIGPLGTLIGNALSGAISWLQLHASWLAWTVFAATTPLQVITGTHWVFVATAISQLGSTGLDSGIMVGYFILALSMTGVSLAVFLKAKTLSLKKTALSSGLTVFFAGVTEPVAYGLCLRYKKPLITAILGCIVAGLYQGIVGIHCYVYAFPAIPSCLMFASGDEPGNFAKAMIAASIAFVSSFLLTLFFGGRLDSDEADQASGSSKA